MPTAGVICEFDPFHKGHQHLFDQLRSVYGADRIVCVMSGDFTQRGHPAGWDKFKRARAAAACGADLVLELPFAYAVSSADLFAAGGIRILKGLSCVDMLGFGSESGDIGILLDAASKTITEDAEISESVKAALSEGRSYADAFSSATGNDAFSSPNDTLAVCYLRENIIQKAGLMPAIVKRIGSGHGSEILSDDSVSSSGIRNTIRLNGNFNDLKDHIPDKAFDLLKNDSFAGFDTDDRLFAVLRHLITVTPAKKLSEAPEISEGLENRIKQSVLSAVDLDSLIKSIKTRRYTYARVSRILMQLLVGITKEDIALFRENGTSYAKVLAFNNKGTSILKEAASNGEISIVSNVNKYRPKDSAEERMLNLDMISADIYSIICGRPIDKYSDNTSVQMQIK